MIITRCVCMRQSAADSTAEDMDWHPPCYYPGTHAVFAAVISVVYTSGLSAQEGVASADANAAASK